MFGVQERVTGNMAAHLEDLTKHYDNMAEALREKESGVEFSEDDLQGMCQLFLADIDG